MNKIKLALIRGLPVELEHFFEVRLDLAVRVSDYLLLATSHFSQAQESELSTLPSKRHLKKR